jgi:uncharacterized protein YecE (DUF72 family)
LGPSQAQLALFDEAPTRGGVEQPDRASMVRPAPPDPELVALAGKLPPALRMGTSSWSFPGWRGLVWGKDSAVSERELAREGLAAYAQHPLLRAVGVDRGYYAPLRAETLRAYASAVPPDFHFLVKAPEVLLRARLPDHPRHGAQRGLVNERALEAAWAAEHVVQPFTEALGSRGGVLLFQFPPQPLDAWGGARRFLARLGRFLRALPVGPRYAVEVRNAALVGPALAEELAGAGAYPCVVAWPGLPSVTVQAELLHALERDLLVMRWMLHEGLDYEAAVARYQPFDRLIDEDPETRRRIADVLHAARGEALLVVNNKAEGSSPRSIAKLAEALIASSR